MELDAAAVSSRPLAPEAEFARAGLDVLLAVVLIAVLSPLLAVVALLVRLTSQGPVLFRQERLGRGRVPFRIYKFRTMKINNDDAAHRKYVTELLTAEVAPHGGAAGVYKLVGDPRITSIGAFLRKTSLDELPQLFNVVRGEMALVGPRPSLAWEAEMFPADTELRFAVRPGITGLWQVGGRGGVDMRTALLMDCEYVRNRSLLFDVRILFRTVAVLFGRSITH